MTCHTKSILVLSSLFLIGSASLAFAAQDDRAVLRDTENQIVHISNGTCVRTKWNEGEDACGMRRVAQKVFVDRKKQRLVSEFSREDRTVHFDFAHAALTPAAKERLDTLVDALKNDQSVLDARIVGYADRIGGLSYNNKLSQKRAEAVRDYLITRGYTNTEVTQTRWVGELEPATNCPAEARTKLIACLQNDRRVEVEINLRHDEFKSQAR